jgi:hypothetical protein
MTRHCWSELRGFVIIETKLESFPDCRPRPTFGKHCNEHRLSITKRQESESLLETHVERTKGTTDARQGSQG